MVIYYKTEDPIADRRADHVHAVKIQIQEMLGIFGHFFAEWNKFKGVISNKLFT